MSGLLGGDLARPRARRPCLSATLQWFCRAVIALSTAAFVLLSFGYVEGSGCRENGDGCWQQNGFLSQVPLPIGALMVLILTTLQRPRHAYAVVWGRDVQGHSSTFCAAIVRQIGLWSSWRFKRGVRHEFTHRSSPTQRSSFQFAKLFSAFDIVATSYSSCALPTNDLGPHHDLPTRFPTTNLPHTLPHLQPWPTR